MKIPSNFIQGASKQQEKALIPRLFAYAKPKHNKFFRIF